MKLFWARTRSSNRLQSLTFDTCFYIKSNFPLSLIRDCLLTQWVQGMNFSDSHTVLFCFLGPDFAMLGGLSFPIGIQKEGIESFINLHKQLAQPGQASVNFPFHLPVLPVAAFCEFEAQDGINPCPFYLIILIILHGKCISCCCALDLLEVGNMHIVTPVPLFPSLGWKWIWKQQCSNLEWCAKIHYKCSDVIKSSSVK